MRFDADRVRSYLDAAGLDAVVLASPANITYAASYLPWNRAVLRQFMLAPGGGGAAQAPVFAVLTADGRVDLIAPAFFGLDAIVDPDVSVHLYGSPFRRLEDYPRVLGDTAEGGFREALRTVAVDAGTALRAALNEGGIDAARIAVDLDAAAPGAPDLLVDVVGDAARRDCSQLMRLIRMVKSDSEIATLRRGSHESEAAGLAAFASVGVGSTPRDLLRAYKSRIGDVDADFDHFVYSTAGLGLGSGGRRDVSFKRGDILAVDWGCLVEGYFTDTGGTLVFGDPPASLLEDQAWLNECIEKGVAQLNVGAPALGAYHAMMAEFTGDESHIAFPHGHALGLELRDLPILAPIASREIRDDVISVDSDVPLEAGMVLNLEVTLLRPGSASAIEVERTFLVTPDGAEPLTHQPRSAPFVAGQGRP